MKLILKLTYLKSQYMKIVDWSLISQESTFENVENLVTSWWILFSQQQDSLLSSLHFTFSHLFLTLLSDFFWYDTSLMSPDDP